MLAHNPIYDELPYKPAIPKEAPDIGIGIVGCGGVARKWHLTAYKKYGLRVVGIYDNSKRVCALAQQQYPELHIYDSLDDLLNDPAVLIVDIATPPQVRPMIMEKAILSGKHILAQKPITKQLSEAKEIADLAAKHRTKVAVNQNGRWAPQWRLASLLIEQNEIGMVQAVTHLYDTRLSWAVNDEPPALGSPHFLTYDYSIHWIDITRCWLDGRKLSRVWAQEYPSLAEFEDGKISQSMWICMEYELGINAVIRGVASAHAHTGHPFWIHGTKGTIRGSVDTLRDNPDSRGGDWIELEKNGKVSRFFLEGTWFPDGFAGTMGELMCAIVENREPYNSLAHNLLSLEATLAACQSLEQGGAHITIRS